MTYKIVLEITAEDYNQEMEQLRYSKLNLEEGNDRSFTIECTSLEQFYAVVALAKLEGFIE